MEYTAKNSDNQNSISRFSRIEVTTDIGEMTDMLSYVERPLEKIFNHFASKNHLMDFDQLSKLAFEFEFFPQMVSKTRLYQFFTLNSEQRKH